MVSRPRVLQPPLQRALVVGGTQGARKQDPERKQGAASTHAQMHHDRKHTWLQRRRFCCCTTTRPHATRTCLDIRPWLREGSTFPETKKLKVRKPLPTRTSPSHRGGSRSRCTNMGAGQPAGLLLLLLLLAGATAQVLLLACVRASEHSLSPRARASAPFLPGLTSCAPAPAAGIPRPV